MQQDSQEQQERRHKQQTTEQPEQEVEQNSAPVSSQVEQQRTEECMDLLRRTQADFVNYRRRMSQEQAEAMISKTWRRTSRLSRFTFGHCRPASAGRSQGPCTSSAGDRTETAGGPSGSRAACQAGRSKRRIGARERCLSSTDVGNPGKADNRSWSDRPARPRSMGTGRARRSRAGAPAGFSGRSWPLFTRGG